MKRILMMCMAACMLTTGFAQTDSTKKKDADTIRIGGMIIVKKPGSREREIITKDGDVKIPRRNYKKENVNTNWWIVDLGFSNFNDKTNYASVATQAFAPGSNEDWFKLRAGKSRNVNIWFFMQRLNMINHVVNLKYGMGLELNNYHFEEDIVFNKKPTLITMSPAEFKKNKLAADYLTVPMMLNFNFTPDRREGFGISGGISAGYLYSARQKTKVGDDKDKVRSDFELKRWKISYAGELLLGPVKLYGSYALDNMWDKGLDQTPYTVGFRLSNW
jgi:hypothetical protein